MEYTLISLRKSFRDFHWSYLDQTGIKDLGIRFDGKAHGWGKISLFEANHTFHCPMNSACVVGKLGHNARSASVDMETLNVAEDCGSPVWMRIFFASIQESRNLLRQPAASHFAQILRKQSPPPAIIHVESYDSAVSPSPYHTSPFADATLFYARATRPSRIASTSSTPLITFMACTRGKFSEYKTPMRNSNCKITSDRKE